jgi:hypothetical protein
MYKAKLAAFCLMAAALFGWQLAMVDTTISRSSMDVFSCSTRAWSAGTDCWLVCPSGNSVRLDDEGATISIVVKGGAGQPIPGVPASDFWLVGCDEGLIPCGGSAGIDADSATNANGETTMSGALAAGGCDPLGVVVVVQGVLVTDPDCNVLCLDIPTVSPDASGEGGVVDLVVELVDFAAFGLVYNKPLEYDACYDYNCDGEVELVDFAIFGQHWGHSCP